MWSQRDLETSIQSLCKDINEHIEFVELSGNVELAKIKKDALHIRYELMAIAKKIESKIEDLR